jgi:hypothetical protein
MLRNIDDLLLYFARGDKKTQRSIKIDILNLDVPEPVIIDYLNKMIKKEKLDEEIFNFKYYLSKINSKKIKFYLKDGSQIKGILNYINNNYINVKIYNNNNRNIPLSLVNLRRTPTEWKSLSDRETLLNDFIRQNNLQRDFNKYHKWETGRLLKKYKKERNMSYKGWNNHKLVDLLRLMLSIRENI